MIIIVIKIIVYLIQFLFIENFYFDKNFDESFNKMSFVFNIINLIKKTFS